jgi:hypothetical protein
VKFAIGFAVGTLVGRPVIKLVSRRYGLSKLAADIVSGLVYDLADSLADMEDKGRHENDAKPARTWRKR